MNIRLPRLMDDQQRTTALLHPTQLSISLNLTPLSTARMTLPNFDAAIQAGDLVELFTSTGSAGVFRVQKVERNHCGLRTVSLEHGLVTLADSLISSAGEQEGAPLEILTQLLACQNKAYWQLGQVDVPADKLLTWAWDYSNVLESLLNLMQELPDYALTFDQSTTPWTLNIIACADEAACECRLNRNILSLKVIVDRTELCTRLYIPPPDPQEEDAEPQEPTILDADTQDKWGVVSRSLAGDPGLTSEELLAEGQRYLDLHKEPLISVTMDARDLSAASGKRLDHIMLGGVCRVCLPEQSEIIRQKVVSIVWPDVYRKPDQITVTLANKTSTAGSILSGLIVDTTVLRKRITQNWNDLQEQRYILIEARENITLLSKDIDLLGKDISLHATEILTLRSGIQDNAAQIVLMDGRITANANAIELQAKDIITLRTGVDDNAAAITLANGRIDAQANDIALHAKDILTLQSGVDDNAAQITLMDGRIEANANEIEANAKKITANADEIEANAKKITANADAISLQASNVITLQAGVDDNKSAIALANGNITALANSISLKADQTSLDLANGNIAANANAISLKADKIELEGLVKATELEVLRADISNLTAGVTIASTLKASILNANTTLIVGGEIAGKRQISMGSVMTAGKVLSTGELDLSHSHAVSVSDDGTVTLGEVSAEGGNFKIADTKAYKDGVSAAYGSGYNEGFAVGKEDYLPTAISRTGYSTEGKTVTVKAVNAHQDLLTNVVIDASEIYEAGVLAGSDNDGDYDAGYADGAASVTLGSAWSSGVLLVSASNGKSFTAKLSKGSETWVDNECTFPILSDGLATGRVVTVDAQARYDAGWEAVAIRQADMVRENDDSYESSTHDTLITIRATATNGATRYRTFRVSGEKAYSAGVSVGKADVTLSAPDGWKNGRYVVEASNGKSHTVSLPEFTTSGGSSFDSSHKTKVYFLTPSATGYLKEVEVDASSVYTNGQTAGANGVTLSKTWSGGILTVKASNDKTSTAKLAKGTESWTDNKVTVPVLDGSESTGYTISVDATKRYNAGWNACLAACEATVQLYKLTQDLTATPLFYADGTAAGTGFSRVVAVTDTYFIPDEK